ncbi:polyprenol phosphomannose-dependent alpha 1,6 mannosyltransferase MptB [Pseudonocardia sp. HH130630-07]|uniref:polyprenol phosphomannose-dependent alpha 1,6 mannosyltransferase MptB n=1 Tax=Pseudonocardia sp. HH130630-07 TaxID=1690815 RepID=UPI000814B9FF|nr:polyprenol phosphomannose-dependent alpha 1,6 mannosyltransferase MptB [Pseudonocardia sp. HH130630-07]ANY06820.1 hypothetical protein AFB00_11555 [Pseudonocardia sp. HH130630-07]
MTVPAGLHRTSVDGVVRLVGLVGAVLLCAGSWAVVRAGAWAPPGLAVACCGVGLVVVAWGVAARAVLRGTVPPPGWSVRTLALWAAPLLVAPPLFSKDVFSYLAQGGVVARGLDPHVLGPVDGLPAGSALLAEVDGHWRATPSPYGPVTDALQGAIAVLTGEGVAAAVALHRVLGVLAVLGVVWAVPRLAARCGIAREGALLLAAANPLVLWHLLGGVHNDGPMLALALCGLAVALRGIDTGRFGPVAAGVGLVTLGALVKAPAAAALAVIAVAAARPPQRRARYAPLVVLGIGAGALAVVTVVSLAVSGATGSATSWLLSTATPGRLGSWMAPTNWPGFAAGALGGPGAAAGTLALGRTVGAVVSVLLVVLLLVRQWQGRRDPVGTLALVYTAVVVLGPVVQPWYVLWAAVPLFASAVGDRARRWTAGAVAVFAVAVPPSAGDFSARVPDLVLAYGAAVVVAGIAHLVLRRAERAPPHAGDR